MRMSEPDVRLLRQVNKICSLGAKHSMLLLGAKFEKPAEVRKEQGRVDLKAFDGLASLLFNVTAKPGQSIRQEKYRNW